MAHAAHRQLLEFYTCNPAVEVDSHHAAYAAGHSPNCDTGVNEIIGIFKVCCSGGGGDGGGGGGKRGLFQLEERVCWDVPPSCRGQLTLSGRLSSDG